MASAAGAFRGPPRITCIIFSKDRPLQLDATLRSLKLNCADLDRSAIRVLYTTSSPKFASLYAVLASEHPDVAFVRESQFKADVVELARSSAHVMFLVDDSVFVGPLSIAQSIEVLEEDRTCLGFSYRLGQNTTYCYTQDKLQPPPAFKELSSGVLTYDWTAAEYDFGYPLEVSSSLYRTADILPLLRMLDYRNPSTLESVLAQHSSSFRDTRPRLACCAQSVALSVPANLVQTMWQNRVASDPALTAEALAEAYARGQRLDVARYRGFVANAAHQELELFLTRRADVPTVSVVIPCYGQAEYLPEAVASVVGQTFTDWELVIVDDGSPDDTAAAAQRLIEQHPDRRIRLLRQQNGGLARARNAGIAASKGRYLLPLDADDAIAPTMLEQTVALLESRRHIGVAYVRYRQFGEGAVVQRLHSFDVELLTAWDYVPYCSLFRREVWEAAGGYSSELVWGYEDWDFWLSAVENGYRMRLIPQVLFRYRVRSGGMYDVARCHDLELKALLRERHSSLYTRRRRAVARLKMARLHPADTIRQALRRLPAVRRRVNGLRRRLASRLRA